MGVLDELSKIVAALPATALAIHNARAGATTTARRRSPSSSLRARVEARLSRALQRIERQALPRIRTDDVVSVVLETVGDAPVEIGVVVADTYEPRLQVRAFIGDARHVVFPFDEIHAWLKSIGSERWWIAHSHVNGDPTPSRGDERVTRAAASIAGFVDHMVIGPLDPGVRADVYSFVRDRYWLHEEDEP